MKLRCWGTRGNLATPSVHTLELGGNTSCYEVELDPTHTLLLDCGTGLIEYATWLLTQKERPIPSEHHIVVTHFHWDHVLGFPFFHVIHRPGTRVHLYSAFDPAQLEEHFRALFDGTYSPLRDLNNLAAKITFQAIPPDGIDLLGAHVSATPVDHSEPCFALRIDKDGRSLCYATDHEARPSKLNEGLLAFAQNASMLVHDAQYFIGEYPRHVGWGHSTIDAALDNGLDAQVERTLLTHHDPKHHDTTRLQYLAALLSTRAPQRAELAHQGVWYAV